MKYLVFSLVVVLAACTEEQSRAVGAQPKKTIDRITTDVNKAMQSDRLKEEEK
ncbi:MAG: hypothetical protein ACREU4_02990 [Burkholderiales bacterium]